MQHSFCAFFCDLFFGESIPIWVPVPGYRYSYQYRLTRLESRQRERERARTRERKRERRPASWILHSHVTDVCLHGFPSYPSTEYTCSTRVLHVYTRGQYCNSMLPGIWNQSHTGRTNAKCKMQKCKCKCHSTNATCHSMPWHGTWHSTTNKKNITI